MGMNDISCKDTSATADKLIEMIHSLRIKRLHTKRQALSKTVKLLD